MSELRVGTSGFHYRHWRGTFYPQALRTRDWFGFYAEQFDTVEINNSFYRLPPEETVRSWREQAPDGFLYCMKFSRYGSHMKKLSDPEGPISLFLERATILEDRLGPILVQLPPGWHADPQRLDEFLDAAPSEHRWAIELRDRDWLRDPVYRVLERHQAALCLHDLIDDHPEVITAKWTYLRFHGVRYGGSYSPQKLTSVARRIAVWRRRGLDVYAYFNNDVGGHAPANARDLLRYAENAR